MIGRNLHGSRTRQIADVLTRHGLGYFVGVLGLERVVPFNRGLLGHARRAEPYTRPEHLRLALEELGATFIKLGQILSTRPDLPERSLVQHASEGVTDPPAGQCHPMWWTRSPPRGDDSRTMEK